MNQNPIKTWIETLEQIRAFSHEFGLVFVQTVAALLPWCAYVFSDQGADVLSMVAEGMDRHVKHGVRAAIWFTLANLMASLAIWWTARSLLSIRWQNRPEPQGWVGRLRDWFQAWWPRILGVTPMLLVAYAFQHRMGDYCAPDVPCLIRRLSLLSWSHGLLAVGLAAFFLTRRAWLERSASNSLSAAAAARPLEPGANPENTVNRRSNTITGQHARTGVAVVVGMVLVSVIFLVVVWISPIKVSQYFGTGALLSFAAVATVSTGALAGGLRARTGFPSGWVLFIWILIVSHVMDNHDIRKSPAAGALPEAPSVDEALTEWARDLPPALPPATGGRPIEPIFIVATEGGGIRAAYWTAQVLGYVEEQSYQAALQRKLPDVRQHVFSRRLFAISGISGGSVGAAVFDALLADDQEDLMKASDRILGQDHLAPLIGALLFPDAVQRLVPWPMESADRARVIERSWEDSYYDAVGKNPNRLREPLRNLHATAGQGAHLPHLLLNSTIVDTGQRLIFSDLAIVPGPAGGVFRDAVDARTVIYDAKCGSVEALDVPLSTAAHASARFTYTNPPGLLSTGQRFVDGGYFEDSGTATALELVEAIEARNQRPDTATLPMLVPIVIVISNEPGALKDGARDIDVVRTSLKLRKKFGLLGSPAALPGAPPCAANESREKQSTEPFQFASEVLSPPRALLATRSARGTLARRTLCEHQRDAWHRLRDQHHDFAWPSGLANLIEPPGGRPDDGYVPTFIQFSIVKEGIPLPLGWALSEAAKHDMQGQITAGEQAPGQSNSTAWAFIQHWLGLTPPQ